MNKTICTEFRLSSQLGPRWAGRTCGLCGNYNGNQGDDFLSGCGLIEGSPQAFGLSWRINGDCESTHKHETDPCAVNPKRGICTHTDTRSQNSNTITTYPPAPSSPFCRRGLCGDDVRCVQSVPLSSEPESVPAILSLRCVRVCGW